MLGLQLATDPRWANIAERNIPEILTDHAFCEQKAASYAISLIVQFPELPDLVEAMSALAIEEMEHFRMVHEKITERGWGLGSERKDPYVRDLQKFFAGGDRQTGLVHKLLMAAMIEARSCERFRLLSQHISDPDLAKFYADLMASEARHYTMFLQFARRYGSKLLDVDKLWEEFLEYEATVMTNYGDKELIHG